MLDEMTSAARFDTWRASPVRCKSVVTQPVADALRRDVVLQFSVLTGGPPAEKNAATRRRSIAVVEPSSGSFLLRLDHPLTGADPGHQPRRHIDLASHQDGATGRSISGLRRWAVGGGLWAVGGGFYQLRVVDSIWWRVEGGGWVVGGGGWALCGVTEWVWWEREGGGGRGRGRKKRKPIQGSGINDGKLPQGPPTQRLVVTARFIVTGCLVRFRLKEKIRLAYLEELSQSDAP